MVEENFPEAFQALKLAKKANDLNAILSATYWLGGMQALHCEFKEAEHNLKECIEVNQAANILWGISSLKSLISYSVYYHEGSIKKGFATSLDAVKFSDESQNAYSKAMAYVTHGVLYYCKGSLMTRQKNIF